MGNEESANASCVAEQREGPKKVSNKSNTAQDRSTIFSPKLNRVKVKGDINMTVNNNTTINKTSHKEKSGTGGTMEERLRQLRTGLCLPIGQPEPKQKKGSKDRQKA